MRVQALNRAQQTREWLRSSRLDDITTGELARRIKSDGLLWGDSIVSALPSSGFTAQVLALLVKAGVEPQGFYLGLSESLTPKRT
ncbi:hypothetical protein ACI3PL_26405, partial [Lacticaseibacillus paracasei]